MSNKYDDHGKLVQKTIIHNDDWSLILVHPKDISKYTELDATTLKLRFAVLSRLMFDNLVTKDQRIEEIYKDEDTNEWICTTKSKPHQ